MAGGIGSGKTTLATILGELGVGIVASDRLNHEELNAPEVLAVLRQWWGDRAIGPDGRADRGVIRRIVAGDDQARQRLEQLIHPRIARRRDELMARYQADPRIRAVVWDSPLLFEVGLAGQCDAVIFVEADAQARLARVSCQRGWTAEDLEGFERLQKPLDFKRENADYTVVNNSDIDDLRRQAEDVFSRILSGARQRG